MKKYESYKVGVLPWAEAIPSHWGIQRAKTMYKKEARSIQEDDEVVTCFRDGQVTLRKNRRTTGFTESIKEVGYQGIKKGDLVIHVMDAFAGAIGVSDSDGKGTPVYSVCTPKGEFNNYYYAYVIREMAKTGFIQSLYRGIRERSSDFRFEVFANQLMPVPSIAEQNQIVRYLDWQVSKLNKLIKSKKNQIALLQEQRHALVNHLVTKGLRPDLPMKDSGLEWIGEIPAHWEIIKLRQLLYPISIKNKPELPLLSVVREKGVIVRNINDQEGNHNFIPDDLSGYKLVEKGQFAMNKMKAWQGSYGVSSYTGIVSPAYFVFNIRFDNLDFLHYALRSKMYVNFFAQASDGIRVGQWDLSLSKMKEIPFLIPSPEEQIEIVNHIEKALRKNSDTIAVLENEIALLQEYCNRLISDVVTGYTDVREIVIPNYENMSDSELIETGDGDREDELENEEE